MEWARPKFLHDTMLSTSGGGRPITTVCSASILKSEAYGGQTVYELCKGRNVDTERTSM